VFGIRLPRALTAAFVNQALKASEGVAGLSTAMRGLIDADMRRMTHTILRTGTGALRNPPKLLTRWLRLRLG
jgi:hypothetical protein